jgi:hypothetical protein
MRTFLKPLFALLVILTAAVLGLHLASQPLLDRLTSRAIRSAESRLKGAGIESRISVEKSRLSLPSGLILSGILADARIPGTQRLAQGWRVQLTIGSAQIMVKDLSAQNFLLKTNDLMLRLQPQTARGADDPLGLGPIDLYSRKFELPFMARVLGAGRVKEDIHALLKSLEQLVREGRTSLRLEFEGKLFFKLEGQPVELGIRTQKRTGEEVRLLLSRDDLMALGDLTEDGLTPAEAALLSENPVRAPRLLAIQRHASRVSKEAASKDPRVPQDAYRHVLWSYLLTKAYGASFAKQITDAHETGVNKKINTPADHRMDFANNRVGIDYAEHGVKEEEVLWKMLSDARVVRSSAQAR